MANGFPRKYSLSTMSGVTAREFERREDAFQQLIGDGLLSMSGHAARSYPTKGEDGSIDSFLEENAELAPPFENLPLPAIIECKDHDDSLQNVGSNIIAGWGKVRAKLASQASKNWPNLFHPWLRAKSYIYIVSAVIPSQQIRETLRGQILEFFRSILVEQRPPIDRVLLMDWNDVRLWLDRFHEVRDSWLGTGTPSILSLAQYSKGLIGFRRFLGSNALPFNAPPKGAVHHPEKLLEKLGSSGPGKGVLLVGAGGVGKTRTSYETALLAQKHNWRVLFILPTDPLITVEQLSVAVLSKRSCKVLIVFEYLDQMPHLDLGAMRRSLIPKACEANIHLAFLANSRPGFVWRPHPERDVLFERVDLKLDSTEARHLSEHAVHKAAPTACEMLSDHQVFRLCGHRPIIALLVALQLERLALSGELDKEAISFIREDDLLGPWLRRRLSEDELSTPIPKSFWDSATPNHRVVAAATVLACAPDEMEGLITASRAALASLGENYDSSKLVKGLLELGWLEIEGPSVVAVHDVVADEMVEQTIFENSSVRIREFSALVAVSLQSARSFGRIAKSLSRTEGATSDIRSTALKEAAQCWLSHNATDIGKMLAMEAPTHGSYAMGSVFGGSIFENAAVQEWSLLVGPWLAKYNTEFEARHLFYRGLRVVFGSPADELKRHAMTWLFRWRLQHAASFVLAPFLYQRETLDHNAELVNGWSVGWLDNYGTSLEAQFVLHPLLGRRDLTETVASQAINFALVWLASHAASQEAQFVLHPLLGRRDLTETVASQAINFALVWPASHGTSPEARFVLRPLLENYSLKEPQASQSLNFALAWLASHGTSPDGGFVLRPLLENYSLKEPQASQSLNFALAWLASHGTSPNGGFVLRPLLENYSLKEPQASQALNSALAWLASHGTSPEAQFVLKPLLENNSLKEPQASQSFNFALAWLASHGNSPEAQFVLKPLLENNSLKEPQASQSLNFALAWLASHGNSPDGGFVLRPLLENYSLKEPQASQALNFALAWLASHGTSPNGGFVLRPLLENYSLKATQASQSFNFALAWLASHGNSPEAQFVLRPLLEDNSLKEPQASQCLNLALAWLASHGTSPEARFVLQPLLQNNSLKEPQASQSFNFALAWLTSHGNSPEASFVIVPCLNANIQNPELRTVALSWCETHWDKFHASFVLTAWLDHCNDWYRISGLVDKWLSIHNSNLRASFLLFAWISAGADRNVISPHMQHYTKIWSNSKVALRLLRAWRS